MSHLNHIKMPAVALVFATMAIFPQLLNEGIQTTDLTSNDKVKVAEPNPLPTYPSPFEKVPLTPLEDVSSEKIISSTLPLPNEAEKIYANIINSLEFNFAFPNIAEEEDLRGCIAGTFAHHADKVRLFSREGIKINLPLNHLVFDENVLYNIDALGLKVETDIFFTYQYLEEYATFVTDLFVELRVTDKDEKNMGYISHAFHLLPKKGGIGGAYAEFTFPKDDLDRYIIEGINSDVSEYIKMYLKSTINRFSKCHYNKDLTKLNEAIEGMNTYNAPNELAPK